MAAKMSVLGLILSSYPYLRSAMVRFPLQLHLCNEVALSSSHSNALKKNIKLKIFRHVLTDQSKGFGVKK